MRRPSEHGTTNIPDAEIECAVRYARTHGGSKLSVSDLAEISGYSPRHFRRKFRDAVGVSPRRYLRQLRIEYAAGELCSKSARVADVALDAGYSSPEALIRPFLAGIGCTPGQCHKLNEGTHFDFPSQRGHGDQTSTVPITLSYSEHADLIYEGSVLVGHGRSELLRYEAIGERSIGESDPPDTSPYDGETGAASNADSARAATYTFRAGDTRVAVILAGTSSASMVYSNARPQSSRKDRRARRPPLGADHVPKAESVSKGEVGTGAKAESKVQKPRGSDRKQPRRSLACP